MRLEGDLNTRSVDFAIDTGGTTGTRGRRRLDGHIHFQRLPIFDFARIPAARRVVVDGGAAFFR